MKIKIGSGQWEVKFVETFKESGFTDRSKQIIYVEKNSCPNQKSIALWHEILHAGNGELDEVTVDFIANLIVQVLTDNKFEEIGG